MNTYAQSQRIPTLQELANDLEEDNEIEYVETKSKELANIAQIEIGDATSIYTKLKQYPYEFEINASLQLASINGEKIATGNSEIEQLKTLVSNMQEKIERLEERQSRKEVLWSNTEVGVRDVVLEKNISDYDLLIVYYRCQGDINEITLDTNDETIYQAEYTHATYYVFGRIGIELERNAVKMDVTGTHSDWTKPEKTYLTKIVGIKL